jgi:hypothetical protein
MVDVTVARCALTTLAVEASAVVRVGGYVGWEHLKGVTAWQARMLGEINLAHSARTPQAHDREASESLTAAQWHELDTTNHSLQTAADS